MNKQFLFFDIDGTLYLPWLGLSERVKSALLRAKSKGHRLFLCTGRSLIGIPQELQEVNFDGVIGSAGAFTQIGNEIIEEKVIVPQRLSLLLQELEETGIAYELETSKGNFYSRTMSMLCERYRCNTNNNSELARLIQGKDFLHRYPIEDFSKSQTMAVKVAFLAEKQEQVEELKKKLDKGFRMIVFGVTQEGTVNGEIVPVDVDKGSAVIQVCRLLGQDIIDTIGFGDSYNDLEMLKVCGKSVVMEDADDELKALADYVCPSIRKDGIYHAMKKMGLC